jgi:hypothetical protein
MCSAWDAQLSQKRNPERDEPERGVDALLDVGEGRSGVPIRVGPRAGGGCSAESDLRRELCGFYGS